ncbi:MAG: hypothetical protein WC683_10025 [bacterium]
MSEKPTPGPWKYDRDGDYITAQQLPDGYAYIIAKVQRPVGDERAANATLIVAAVNACFAAGGNPLKVAGEWGEAMFLVRTLARRGCVCDVPYKHEPIDDCPGMIARRILSAMEVKP